MSDRSPARHRWDVSVGLAAALFLTVYAFGPFELVPTVPALALTWRRAFVLFALILFVRHVRHPRPSLVRVLVAGIRARFMPDGTTRVLGMAVASRAAVVAAGLAAALVQGTPPYGAPKLTEHPFWNLPARWDAFWYLSIAEHGYSWDPAQPDREWNVAFFPAFPALMRIAGHVVTMPGYWLNDDTILGGTSETRLIVGGWLLSMIAFAWGLANVYALARDDVGHVRASWAALLTAYFPFAVFYSAPYSEGVFFLAITSAFLAARQRRIAAVFWWGVLTALTRQTGVMVAAPLALLAISRDAEGQPPSRWDVRWRGWRLDGRLLAAAAGPAVGLGIHLIVLWWQVGDPFAWVKAQQGWWHSDSALPFYAERIKFVRDHGFTAYFNTLPGPALGTFIPIAALVLLPRVWKISPAYAALVLVTLAPAVAIDTPSIGRIAAPLFPLFVALASVLPSRKDVWVLAGIFGFGQLWAACIFFEWGMLY